MIESLFIDHLSAESLILYSMLEILNMLFSSKGKEGDNVICNVLNQ